MGDASVEPRVMPLDLLRKITNGFSEERKLGSGSFGKVYMGMYQNGEKIAVKMLYDMPGLDDEQFQNEFKNLTRLRHQNIVRLVGYCHDVQEVQVKYKGKLVLAEKTHRALCLEHMSNGSLDKFLSDKCDRYDWHTCYRIIKGISQGLKYLHTELKPPIYHLDLKPANVLLDENMVPRIADFGISRLFSDDQTRSTQSLLGTLGYSPPEFIHSNLISNKFDIFSLGVIILKLMAGRAGFSKSTEMSSQEFTDLVQANWTNRLLETSNRRDAYSEQVKICIQIGLSCVQEDRHKRPTIQDIAYRLEESETKCSGAARKDWFLIFEKAKMHTATDTLPGIEGLKIIGDSSLGSTLKACGLPTNGTTHYEFQWVHCLEQGTTQPIEGAMTYDYMVTADDVGTLLAVDCTPVDKDLRKGDLMRVFADSESKIVCDPGMQNDIDTCISRGTANFNVFVLSAGFLVGAPDEWEKATLELTRSVYRIKFSHRNDGVIDEKYSPSLKIKIPIGGTTQFVLKSRTVLNLLLSTEGITGPNNKNNDIRLRNLIVLVMRTFKNKEIVMLNL